MSAEQLPKPAAEETAAKEEAAPAPAPAPAAEEKSADGEYKCHCGKCSFKVSGEPAMAAFCHCHTCRVYLGGRCQAVVYPPGQFVYGEGTEENLIKYESAEKKFRHACKNCGCAVHNTLPNGLQVTFAGGITWADGGKVPAPTMHIWVADGTREKIADGLPQFDEWPK